MDYRTVVGQLFLENVELREKINEYVRELEQLKNRTKPEGEQS